MRSLAGLAAGLTLLLATSAGATSIIVNGSFESGADPGAFAVLPGGSGAITGWTVLGNSVDYIGPLWQASNGTRSVDLEGNGPGGLSQTFATSIGQRYLVTFDLAGNPVVPGVKTARVSVGGLTLDFNFDSTGKNFTNMGYVTQSFEFVAQAATSTLAFQGIAPGNSFGAVLDNVSVALAPTEVVPEPSTALLMAGGLAGLAGLRRRRS